MIVTKRWIVVLVIIVLVFGGTFGFNYFKHIKIKEYFANFKQPPATVSSVKAKSQTWHPSLYAVGSIDAINGVDVNPRVSGQVTKIYFKSGQFVKKDDPLFQLDDSLDQQSLRNSQAQLRLDKLTYERYADVVNKGGVTQQQVDQAEANYQKSLANVQTAKLNIKYKKILAPFAGRTGIRKVDVGQFVQAGTAMVTLQSLDPLYIDFNLPQKDIQLIKDGQPVTISTDALPGKTFPGKITAINSKIDTNTRMIQVQATVPNPSKTLFPGLFTNVVIQLPAQNDVVTLPQTAVTYSLYGNTVFVLTPKGKDKKGQQLYLAQQRFVTLGQRRDTEVAITKGIKAGEMVAATGQIKLQNNSMVVINNSIPLKDTTNADG